MIFVKTSEQIRKGLIKIPACEKDGNWSSTLIKYYKVHMGTEVKIHRQPDFVCFAAHKMTWFVSDYDKYMKAPVNTSINR